MGHRGQLGFSRGQRAQFSALGAEAGGDGFGVGGNLRGNESGSGAEESRIWAELSVSTLAGAQIRCLVLSKEGHWRGIPVPLPHHCQPRHSSELGTIPAQGQEEATFASK